MKINRILLSVVITLVIIGIIIIINVLSISNIEAAFTKQSMSTQSLENKYAADQIESHILQVRSELVTLSKFPEIDILDTNKCHDESAVHESNEGRLTNVLRVTKSGDVIECSSALYSSYVGLNVRNKDYFSIAKDTNEPYVSIDNGQSINRQIIVSVPLFETTEYTPYPNFLGEFNGVLMSIIEINSLYNLYIHPIANSEKTYFSLVNINSNNVILQSNILDGFTLRSNTPSEISQIVKLDLFGDTIVTTSDLVLGNEVWRLYLFTPVDNLDNNLSSVRLTLMIVLFSLILIILAGLILTIRFYKSKEQIEEKLEKTSMTLEKLGINVEVEKEKFNRTDIVLDSRNVYLITDDEENQAHELFISTLNRGFAGLGIIRNRPNEFKEKYQLEKTSLIWLSKQKLDGVVSETKVRSLQAIIKQFFENSKHAVVLIDSLDYLFTQNSFEDILMFVQSLRDLVSVHEGVVVLSLNPAVVDERELKAIKSETIDVFGNKKKVNLSELEINILKYINDGNTNNKLVNYKDITSQFNITKPTTRAKIANLQQHGFVEIEQKGRFKSLKITSLGRKII